MVADRGHVVVAMSGGVDSSVAAALLVEAGYRVTGVMMRLWAEGLSDTAAPGTAGAENRCCTDEAVNEARQVASLLGIPFRLVDYEDAFKACVVDYFVAEYSRGRTPNPCLACNRHLRFGRLLEHAQALGADRLATGHYARVDRADGRYRLRVGVDPNKDQSYVLYVLTQEALGHVLFPLGRYTKPEVRELARRHGLPVADREDSMELCFVGDDDYRGFLRRHSPQVVEPGPILDSAGGVIGRHRGLPFYTVGQRRGLGIAAAEPLYVIRLDVARNTLVVGPAAELGRQRLTASDVCYVAGQAPRGPLRVQAKIRYRAKLAGATWIPLEGGRAEVEFDRPLRDITPGQAVVAYQGDEVVGGGLIDG
ncbi:MAG: tRNA 2-thiouridine(34) synthase MnmA [Anaerolineae bacterium]